MHAQRARLDQVERSVLRILLNQFLPQHQGKGLHVAGKDLPLDRAQVGRKVVSGVVVGDGLDQALNVEFQRRAQWCIHSCANSTVRQSQRQAMLTATYT